MPTRLCRELSAIPVVKCSENSVFDPLLQLPTALNVIDVLINMAPVIHGAAWHGNIRSALFVSQNANIRNRDRVANTIHQFYAGLCEPVALCSSLDCCFFYIHLIPSVYWINIILEGWVSPSTTGDWVMRPPDDAL